jgi:hypothetical protein
MDYGFDFTNEICYISTWDGNKMEDLEPVACPSDLEGRLAFLNEYQKKAEKVMVVVEELSKEILSHSREDFLFLSKEEAFAAYVFNQENEMWKQDTAVFEFHRNYFSCMQLKLRGNICLVSKTSAKEVPYFDSEKEKDKFFTKQMANQLNSGGISNVFLVGKEFEGNWMELSLTSLCNGRRVFMGNHLFANGALLWHNGDLKNQYPLVTDDYHLYYWGIRTFHHGQKDVFAQIIKPGEFWFATEGSIQILVDECASLEIEGLHSITKQKLQIQLPVPAEAYPKRTTKLKIRMRCVSTKVLEITMYDMGFGVTREGKGLIYREEYKLP